MITVHLLEPRANSGRPEDAKPTGLTEPAGLLQGARSAV